MKSNINKAVTYLLTGALFTMLFLKWFGFADFSYWVVFSPFWISIVVLLVLLIAGIIIGTTVYFFRKWKAKIKK